MTMELQDAVKRLSGKYSREYRDDESGLQRELDIAIVVSAMEDILAALPPRGHPDRLEAMRRNVDLGLSPFAGDDGTAIPYPDPPADSVFVPIQKVTTLLSSKENLRYFGPDHGWRLV